MRKIIENPHSVGTLQNLACVACVVTVARGKKMSDFGRCDGETYDRGSPPPIPSHRVAQQVSVWFAGMHPNFGSACGDLPGDRTPEMNEIGDRTHIASRAGGVLGVFGAKNHRKSVQRRNATNFGERGSCMVLPLFLNICVSRYFNK